MEAIFDVLHTGLNRTFAAREGVHDPAHRRYDADDREDEDDKEEPRRSLCQMNQRLFHAKPLCRPAGPALCPALVGDDVVDERGQCAVDLLRVGVDAGDPIGII